MEEIGHLRLQRDGRGGDRAHLRDAVGVARDDAGGRSRNGALVAGERPEVVAEAEAFEGVVEDVVERELGALGEAVVELQVETRLLAVVIIVLGTEVPEVGGRRGGVLEVARGAEEADRLLAVEQVERHPEVPLAAQHAEDLLPRDVQQRVGAVLLAQGDLLGARRGDARREIISDAPLLLHPEGRAALEVHRPAERAGLLVGRVPLGHFQRLEHRAGHRVDARLPRVAALAAQQGAVDGDGVTARSHPADGEPDDVALVAQVAGHARQEHRELARVHIRQIPVGVERDDVLHVGRVALGGQRGRVALALAGDGESVEAVDRRGEVEAPGGGRRAGDGYRPTGRFETEITGDQLVGAVGDVHQHVAAGGVGEGGQAEPGYFDPRAFEEVAGRGVTDGAGHGAGERGERGQEGRGEEEGAEQAVHLGAG